MAPYAPAAVVADSTPDTPGHVVVLFLLVTVCMAVVGVMLVLLARSARPPMTTSTGTTANSTQPLGHRGSRAGGATCAVRSRRGHDVARAVDEDDVIAFGLALEACPDAVAHVLGQHVGRSSPCAVGSAWSLRRTA